MRPGVSTPRLAVCRRCVGCPRGGDTSGGAAYASGVGKPGRQVPMAPSAARREPRCFALCCRRHRLTFFCNGSAQHANHVAHAEDANQRMLVKNRKMTNAMSIHLLDDVREIVLGRA